MTESKSPPKIAVCLDCGHTWKPYNTSTTSHKRRCAKCKSYNVEIRDAPTEPETTPEAKPTASAEPETNPVAELTAIINTPPHQTAKKTAEKSPPVIKPLHLTIAFIILTVGAIGGASWYFRRRPPAVDQPRPDQTQPPAPIPRTRITGL
ncbi:hypothetical protein [Methanocorpusculum vombati]|uniref:Zinc finger/thioredoxin putative domain-containing protein n=1 Tax=Methanocorpusculum vombati TaxID=3002864 RepID=A0ABT4IKJ6_9EURY|nr:hypothetical protein [Methanocorpusculum vombati]MCZ9319577.1 hypothetical protein [Methanocorpusculum sp.]MCZ0862266.1 hypothetical protein [Methanocorpusculum vombati]MDE2519746.1 hypothetical protein [Methanocorpusculum sp.]MDE2534474.1 hypothetical protein [Methanocorpusculum sp.]MDE2547381.1 hypothetical protein [Methanocorpusculum sp.]